MINQMSGNIDSIINSMEESICKDNIFLPQVEEKIVDVEKAMVDIKARMRVIELKKEAIPEKLYREWERTRKIFKELLTIKSDIEIKLLESQ